MQLTLWTYEGPPHIGAIRVAASFEDVHCVLHAPQGDTYADLLFTMIERMDRRPPVTYTTFQARDLGGETASLAKRAVADAYERFRPQLLLVGESCTAELLQDQAGNLGRSLGLPVPVVPLELSAYSKKENWGAGETLYRIVRSVLQERSQQVAGGTAKPERPPRRPLANIIGPTVLGFRCRDDVVEVDRILEQLGIDVNAIIPLGASVDDIGRLPDASFNVCLYPEVSRPTTLWMQRAFGMPFTRTVPIGLGATRAFIAEVAQLAGVDARHVLAREQPGVARLSASQARTPWYARSVDSTYLTGKRAFIFGDATHAIAAARIATEEIGFKVVGLGTYSREFAREVREAAGAHGIDALITDDYLEVEQAIAAATPELVLGTQMERHVAKRLGIPCAVISAPMHVQDVPARYSPVMGFEGANVLFDSWVHPLMMGLEEHLLQMFRGDFEFHDEARASHLPASAGPNADVPLADMQAAAPAPAATAVATAPTWSADGERELQKIPFFVRPKARRNTERFAAERGVTLITVETLYEAKAHFAR
ncbi:MAG TPA: ferredoxin:protochlorophyllide reductase (ATP-dependent) subunit B [Burkholderiaceae bacterium]|nr:ferredoxin:protochlorophyllide reductase (ATP-dependent) subunit B [Burkholderiaceae bacterium]